MNRLLLTILQGACLALGLVLLCDAAARASGPVKIDAGVYWRFDVKLGGGPHIPKAPWYAYFPYDPNLQGANPGSPYPVWPQTFPSGVEQAPAPTPVPDLQAGSCASGVHTAGYRGVPSYWYGR